MWKYLKGVEDRFHIFVAVSNEANGDKAYHSRTKIVRGARTRPAHAEPLSLLGRLRTWDAPAARRQVRPVLLDLRGRHLTGHRQELSPPGSELRQGPGEQDSGEDHLRLHVVRGQQPRGERPHLGQAGLAASEIGSRFGSGHPHEHEHRGRQHAPLGGSP
jgi:hypothetical protein